MGSNSGDAMAIGVLMPLKSKKKICSPKYIMSSYDSDCSLSDSDISIRSADESPHSSDWTISDTDSDETWSLSSLECEEEDATAD